MSIARNIVANYAGQVVVTLMGLLMLPLLVRYMGPEGFGLVAFFINMQVWFQLLDMGLTPTMIRETARYRGGALDPGQMRHLLRAMEFIFAGLALLGGAALILGAGAIASRWLNADQLPLALVEQAIMLMACIVACRWVSGLYRGVINGLEQLVWLNTFNIFIATARFVLVIPVIVWFGAGPMQFFGYQLLLAILELTVLAVHTYRQLGLATTAEHSGSPWHELRRVRSFALGVAVANVVWILSSQVDKILLAKLLSLTDYGYFTVATVVAGGILLVAGPVSGAVLPRMTAMYATGDNDGMIRLYRDATQLVAAIAVPVASMLALFPEQVLWVWTGDEQLVKNAAPVLSLYAAGSGLLVLAAFPYYLQNVKGAMRLHVAGTLLFVFTLIPTLLWAIKNHGMLGAGWAWLLTNLASFLLWVPVVHRYFAPGLHLTWLGRDIVQTSAMPILCAGLLYWIVAWPFGRLGTLVQLLLITGTLLGCAVGGSSTLRGLAIARMKCV